MNNFWYHEAIAYRNYLLENASQDLNVLQECLKCEIFQTQLDILDPDTTLNATHEDRVDALNRGLQIIEGHKYLLEEN